MDLLPQSFRDAVDVTRMLGLRYLWIDSLCIIQDSPEDWDEEASHMADVYSNAYCTIAATRAEGSNAGFLQERQQRQCLPVRPASGIPYYLCPTIDNFRDDVENGALNQRGWVLQERVLSSRTIYFAESQVYWECGEGVYCETMTKLQKYDSVFSSHVFFPVLLTTSPRGMIPLS